MPEDEGQKVLRAIDYKTGRIVWSHAQTGKANSWAGVLSTASGLLFFGEDGGGFSAFDARTGRKLWSFAANQTWKASPMTFASGGRQFVAIAGGPNILVFGLPSSK